MRSGSAMTQNGSAGGVPKLAVALPATLDGSSFATFVRNSAATVAVSLPKGGRASAFRFAAEVWHLPSAVVTRARDSAILARRGGDEIAHDPAKPIFIYLYTQGGGTFDAGRGSQTVEPGDILVNDMGRPHVAEIRSFAAIYAQVPRERAPPVFLAPGAHGLVFPAASGTARLLAGALRNLVDAADHLTLAEADGAVEALFTLAAGLVASRLAREPAGGFVTANPLLGEALAFIEAHLRDPDLVAARIGSAIGTSRSGLYRLFDPLGGVDGAVTQRRLDHVMRDLLTASGPLPSPSQLAAAYGFRSEGRFLRAFDARFGTSPSRFKDMVESRDHDWLIAQAQRAGFGSLELWLKGLTRGRAGEM